MYFPFIVPHSIQFQLVIVVVAIRIRLYTGALIYTISLQKEEILHLGLECGGFGGWVYGKLVGQNQEKIAV